MFSSQDMLNEVLDCLPLKNVQRKLARKVFFYVLDELDTLYKKVPRGNRKTRGKFNYENKEDRIEALACKDNLKFVIAFFEAAGAQERLKYLWYFPKWRVQRMKNIEHLRSIAESIHKDRTICNVAKISGGVVGAVGGAAIIGSLLFPPLIPAVLPAWLGGAAVTALIPSILLPTTVAVSSPLAIGGGIAAGVGGIAQIGTSITELALLTKNIKEAQETVEEDRENFQHMEGWFKYTEALREAVDKLFGTNAMDIIFKDLKDFFEMDTAILDGCFGFWWALRKCVGRIWREAICSFLNYDIRAVAITVMFVIFLIARGNRFLYDCVILTQRICLGLVSGLDAGVEFTRLLLSAGMKGPAAELIPKALARKVAVGAFAGVGITLDIANIILSSVDLCNGSTSDEQTKISAIADEFQKEIDFLAKVYLQLRQSF